LFDPKVVDMVLDNTSDETIELYCKTVYGDHYYAGSCDLGRLGSPGSRICY